MAVLPAAVIGFEGSTDGIGPKGWRGLAELFGRFGRANAGENPLHLVKAGARLTRGSDLYAADRQLILERSPTALRFAIE